MAWLCYDDVAGNGHTDHIETQTVSGIAWPDCHLVSQVTLDELESLRSQRQMSYGIWNISRVGRDECLNFSWAGSAEETRLR